jgi:hypothetical protein
VIDVVILIVMGFCNTLTASVIWGLMYRIDRLVYRIDRLERRVTDAWPPSPPSTHQSDGSPTNVDGGEPS